MGTHYLHDLATCHQGRTIHRAEARNLLPAEEGLKSTPISHPTPLQTLVLDPTPEELAEKANIVALMRPHRDVIRMRMPLHRLEIVKGVRMGSPKSPNHIETGVDTRTEDTEAMPGGRGAEVHKEVGREGRERVTREERGFKIGRGIFIGDDKTLADDRKGNRTSLEERDL